MAIAVEAAAQGLPVVWGAPTYDQVRVGWDETRHAAGQVAHFVVQRMSAEFPTGGVILFRSLDDPDNARGHTAAGVVIDEVGDVKPEAWYEVLRPMLIDTGGWAWMIGTPKGRNWFYKEHRNALDRTDSMSWQVPTLGCEVVDGVLVRKAHPLENPDIPFSEIQQIYHDTPLDTFRQEILAEFVEHQGSVFRNLLACLNAPMDATPEQHRGHRIVLGADWGKQADFSALSVVCADCGQELALDRFNQIDYHFQRARLVALAQRWGVGTIEGEANAMGEPILEELRRDPALERVQVVAFQTTATSKPPLIESLALAFERTEAQWLDNPTATAELEAYERKASAITGRPQYSAPEGMNDDTVMARALAWHAATSITALQAAPSIYEPLAGREAPPTRREVLASTHDPHSALHIKWAKRNFCAQCWQEAQRDATD